MSALDEITGRQHAVMTITRRTAPEVGSTPYAHPGQLLTMADGARWFHAYDGADPVRITPDNESALKVGG